MKTPESWQISKIHFVHCGDPPTGHDTYQPAQLYCLISVFAI